MTHTRGRHPLIGVLRIERKRQKLTQAALAQRIGWATHTVTNAETGRSSPSLVFVADYASGLGMSLVLLRPPAD